MISIEKEDRPWGRFFVLHNEHSDTKIKTGRGTSSNTHDHHSHLLSTRNSGKNGNFR